MGDLRRALAGFAKAYAVAAALLALLAFAVARVASLDAISLYQLLIVLIGVGYVFASILAWTGFANIYRYSPTLFIGSMSYRRSVIRSDQMAKEGRDTEALAIGILFGLSLIATGVAFFGWMYAALVVVGVTAVLLYAHFLESNPATPD